MHLTAEGIAILDRIYDRLTGCNAGAGFNYIDTPALRDAYSIIEHIYYTYTPRPAMPVYKTVQQLRAEKRSAMR